MFPNPTVMTTQISVFPNPFVSSLSFEVMIPTNEATIVRMMDENHKIIKLLRWSLKRGTNKTTLDDLHSLPAGDYFVDIKNMEGEALFTTKLIKL